MCAATAACSSRPPTTHSVTVPPEATWWNILTTLAQALSYAVLVWYVAKRMNLQNTTRPPATVAATP